MNIKRTSAFVFTTLLISTLSACGPRTETGYTVSFQTHGGTPVETLHNVTLIEKEPVSERNDYVLEGWYTSLESDDKLSFPLTVSEDMTLHAKWEVQEGTEYGYSFYDGYYGELTWNNSEDLINKLHTIISSNVTQLDYNSNWDTNRAADQSLVDHEMIDAIYGVDDVSKTLTYQSGNGGWQREHAFPASLMTGLNSSDAASKKSRATDFHNLFAATYNGNTSRGNKNYGPADPQAEGYQETPAYKSDATYFEPSDNDKGDVARAIFYMAVMYNQNETVTVSHTLNYNAQDQQTYGKQSQAVQVTTTYKPLVIQEDYVSFKAASYTQWHYKESASIPFEGITDLVNQYGEGAQGYGLYLAANCQYAIGGLSYLLAWNNANKVELGEYQHNISVYAQQNNRNPFVDYPQLVDYCFGSKKDQAGDLNYLKPTYLSLEMNKDNIHHYAIDTAKREYDVNETFTSADYNVVAVKNNLSEVEATYQDETPSYTFTAQDATNRSKTLIVNTPINDISYKVKVNEGGINSCSYIYQFVSGDKSLFPSATTATKTSNIGGVNWNIASTNANIKPHNFSGQFGEQVGVATNNQGIGTLTLETIESYTINAFYFRGQTKANGQITLDIYVNNVKIINGSIVRGSGSAELEIVGNSFNATTGKVKIVITSPDGNAGVAFFHTIAFNEAN